MNDMKAHRLICPQCKEIFSICVHCYRGHRYCSSHCKTLGRRQTYKRSSSAYQSSFQGRKNHRQRQKIYRKNRQLQKSVTQHSSVKLVKALNKPPSLRRPVNIRSSHRRSGRSSGKPNCLCCGRPLDRFFNYF